MRGIRALVIAMALGGCSSGCDGERAQKEIEELIQRGTAEVDAIVGRKEKDILEV